MQQFTPVSILPTSPQTSGSSSTLGIQGMPSNGSGVSSEASVTNPFGQIFETVSEVDSQAYQYELAKGWDAFNEQYPELMEWLGEDFDLEAFFSQFQIEGQSLSLATGATGEMLPAELNDLDGVLGQMAAWFKQSGFELTTDDNGQIMPVQIDVTGLENVALPVSDSTEGMEVVEKIADSINQIISGLSGNANSEDQPVVLSGRIDLSANAASLSGAGQVGQSVGNSPVQTAQAAAMNAPVATPQPVNGEGVQTTNTSTSVNPETLSAQTSNQQSSSGQGGFQQGQNEADAQFKALLDANVSNAGKDESVDNLIAKVTGVADRKFADVQAKMDSTGLKQYSTGVNVHVQDPAWGDQMTQKVVWMTGRNIQAAEIHLNPAELGPVDVKISVQNETASITFNVQHASVRELLESNVQRLRDMMESNGVELVDVDVSGEQDQQQFASQSDDSSENGTGLSGEDGVENSEEGKQESVIETSPNLVDFYA